MLVPVGTLEYYVEVTGDVSSRPAVLLLHGFPDSSRLWQHQVPALVAAGYATIVPDMLGYGRSSKPQDPEPYRLKNIICDLIALLDALGVARPVHLVGHDWGAATAWRFATTNPARVASLTALSVGHPAGGTAVGGARQRARWWYFLFFQYKGSAEACLQAHDWRLFREFLGTDGGPDAGGGVGGAAEGAGCGAGARCHQACGGASGRQCGSGGSSGNGCGGSTGCGCCGRTAGTGGAGPCSSGHCCCSTRSAAAAAPNTTGAAAPSAAAAAALPPATPADPAAEEYIAALSQAGTLTAALNWYRANFQVELFAAVQPRGGFPVLRMPVLGVWSEGDAALLEDQMVASACWVAPGLWRYERVAGANHWIPREAPGRLNALLVEFLGGVGGARARL